jgi:putative peptide zinc metalloprotease protein
MIQLRPTFSESWYRVASLKPKLRAGAQISRQFYRGERWYVVRDPAGNQFHRLSDPAYCFIGLLDGRRTIEEAWDLVGGHLADDAPTQPEVIQILSQLYAANLLETDVTPDSAVLLRRHKEQQKRKMQNRLMNVLFPRFPLWDPDQFLVRWLPVVRHLFSKFGAVIWLIVVGAAVATLAPRWQELRTATAFALDFKNNLENVFWLWCTFVLIKLIHELGHAFACRRFGGECHELGLMFLVLVPTPYVDASTAWAFPSRWQRIFVGADGMIVELFFASLCAFVWLGTSHYNYMLINQLAYNAMLIASVSTLVFNANPLLRYDGYYILSDLLEIPNLRQKSVEYTMGLIKRHVFRLKLQQPLPPPGQRIWLFLYAVASSIYRVFVGVMIIVIVAFKVPVLGQLMAIGGIVTWLGVPLYKVSKYILLEPELHRKRWRAAFFAMAVAALAFVLVGRIPFPVRFTAQGIVEPRGKEVLNAQQAGFVTNIVAADGQFLHGPVRNHDGKIVKPGDLILVCRDDDLETAVASDRATLAATLLRKQRDLSLDRNEYAKDLAEEKVRTDKLNQDVEKQASLTIRAPIDGYLIAPKINQMMGVFIARGQEIAIVADTRELRIKVDVDQRDAQLVQEKPNMVTEIRMTGMSSTVLASNSVLVLPGAQGTLADPALGAAGGGEVPTDPKDPHGMRTVVPQFEVRVIVANAQSALVPGQRAVVRFTVDSEPLIVQWYRRFLQLINTQDTGKWM